MLAPKVVAAVVFVWVVGSLLGILYEMEAWTELADEVAMLNPVSYWTTVTTEGPWGVLELPGMAVGYFRNLFNIGSFQFSFLAGEWELVRWIVFTPVIAMVAYGLIMTVIGILRGTISS